MLSSRDIWTMQFIEMLNRSVARKHEIDFKLPRPNRKDRLTARKIKRQQGN